VVGLDVVMQLPCFDVSGHVQPIDGPTSLACTKSYSLSRLLPASAHINVASVEHQLDGDVASHASLLTKKKSTSSLLTSVKPDATGLSKSHQHDDILAADCATASAFDGVCYHPCHTLAYLLDAIHWSMLLMIDDAVRRWPLQLDAPAFRRLLSSLESPTQPADDGHSALSDWWSHMLMTGDVPCIDFESVVPQQFPLQLAMTQLRQHTFQQIAQRLQMDAGHQKAQFSDWMSVSTARLADIPDHRWYVVDRSLVLCPPAFCVC
jgi:hypothetical protein